MPKYLSQNTDVLIFIFLFYRPRGRTLKSSRYQPDFNFLVVKKLRPVLPYNFLEVFFQKSGHPPLRRLKIKQKFLNASRLSYTSYIKQNLFRGLFKGKHPPTTSKKFFKVFRDFMASLKSYFLNFLETKNEKAYPPTRVGVL